jgi:hypothetical protein
MNPVKGTVALALAAGLTACSNAHPSASVNDGGSGTKASSAAGPSSNTSTRSACDIGDKANNISFVTQYIVPGTERKGINSSSPGEFDVSGGSQCEYRWTGRPASDRPDDAPDALSIYSRKYGSYEDGEDRDAQAVIQLGQRMRKKDPDNPLNPGFQPLLVNDIAAGAVIGVDGFYVAGTHGYYYEVILGDWKPNQEVIPSLEAMARAIANADQ